MTKFFNAILILIILVAGGRLAMQGQQHRALVQEQNQLVEKLDGFKVRDRSKYFVQMVDTGDPVRFMWRIHVPGGFQTQFLTKIGSKRGDTCRSFGFTRQGSLERVSVSFECAGDFLRVDTQTLHNGSCFGHGSAELVAFFQQHWNDLEVEILGKEEPVEIDANQFVNLLSIKIPDELHGKLEAQFGKKVARRFSSKWFCRIGFGEEALVERIRQQTRGALP